MKLDDIITLVKAGVKPSEIKDLLEYEPQVKAPEGLPKEESSEDDQEDKTDYKSLYEESQKKLKEAQAKNVNKNSPEPKSADEQLTDVLSSFFDN